ncbi:hypothetical protein HpNP90_07260 [Helicobacter pylori]
MLIFDIDNDKDKPNISLEETKNLFKKHGIETLIIPSRTIIKKSTDTLLKDLESLSLHSNL